MSGRLLISALMVLVALGVMLALGPCGRSEDLAAPPVAAVPAPGLSAELPPLEELPDDPERVPLDAATAQTSAEPAEVELPEPEPDTRWFWGRLVDRETGRPVAGATIEPLGATQGGSFGSSRKVAQDEPRPLTVTDELGYFQLAASESGRPAARTEPAGYGRIQFLARIDHPTREQAQVLTVSRSAGVAVTLFSASGEPLPDARVGLVVRGYTLARPEGEFIGGKDLVLSGTTDAAGGCLLEGLPPGVPIEVTVQPPGGEERSEPDKLTLEPGELRDLRLEIGTGARIAGLLVDQDDRPLPKLEIWLVSDRRGGVPAGARRFLNGWEERHALRKVRTDPQGRFEFDDVQRGCWWVGPQPLDEDSSRRVRRARQGDSAVAEGNPDAVSPLALAVVVNPGDSRHEITLVCERGLFVSGRVTAEGGEVSGARVSGRLEELEGAVDTVVDSQGRFVLGPLSTGAWTLKATHRPSRSDAEPRIARPGERDVELPLLPGGSFSGRIVDGSTGEPADGAITIWSPPPTSHLSLGFPSQGKPEFSGVGLRPGTYDVTARTADGRAGTLRGIEVRRGETAEDLRVEVHPGARLRIFYSGPATYGNYKVFDGPSVVCGNGLHTGTSELEIVPAGRLRVELDVGRVSTVERTVQLAPGEEGLVVFEID